MGFLILHFLEKKLVNFVICKITLMIFERYFEEEVTQLSEIKKKTQNRTQQIFGRFKVIAPF